MTILSTRLEICCTFAPYCNTHEATKQDYFKDSSGCGRISWTPVRVGKYTGRPSDSRQMDAADADAALPTRWRGVSFSFIHVLSSTISPVFALLFADRPSLRAGLSFQFVKPLHATYTAYKYVVLSLSCLYFFFPFKFFFDYVCTQNVLVFTFFFSVTVIYSST